MYKKVAKDDEDDFDWICRNNAPKDFLTLIRNTILYKLTKNAHLSVRTFFSSD